MIAFGLTVAILCMAGIFACGMLAGHQLAHRKTEPIDWSAPAPLPVNVELAAANDAIHARDLIIETLTTLRQVPASEWSVLPWSASEVMKLREQLTDALDDCDYFHDLKTKHWAALQTARAKLRTLTPIVEELPLLYTDFERETSFKDGYHGLARTFVDRITNAREAIASDAMRDEIDGILCGAILQFPQERIAA